MRQHFHCLQWYAGSERVKEIRETATDFAMFCIQLLSHTLFFVIFARTLNKTRSILILTSTTMTGDHAGLSSLNCRRVAENELEVVILALGTMSKNIIYICFSIMTNGGVTGDQEIVIVYNISLIALPSHKSLVTVTLHQSWLACIGSLLARESILKSLQLLSRYCTTFCTLLKFFRNIHLDYSSPPLQPHLHHWEKRQ